MEKRKPITNQNRPKQPVKIAFNKENGVFYGPFKLSPAASSGQEVCALLSHNGKELPILFN